MAFTKQRKVYAAVLAVAGAALFTDRFLLADSTGPAAASAESLLITKPAADPASPAHQAAPTPALSLPAASAPNIETISDRLLGMADKEPSWKTASTDAFNLPLAWGNPFASTQTANLAPARPSINAGAYRLTSVLSSRTDGTLIAVINGQPLHVNDDIDGVTVTSINPGSRNTPGSAVLTRDGEETQLTIQSPDTGRTRLSVSPAKTANARTQKRKSQ